MKKIIQILLLFITISCDPALENQYTIDNRTSSTVEVRTILKNNFRNQNDTVKITELKPNSKSLISEYTEIGNAHDKKADFLQAYDTIIVKNKNKQLNKNIFDRANWEFIVLKRKTFSMDKVEYKLILTESDFN